MAYCSFWLVVVLLFVARCFVVCGLFRCLWLVVLLFVAWFCCLCFIVRFFVCSFFVVCCCL